MMVSDTLSDKYRICEKQQGKNFCNFTMKTWSAFWHLLSGTGEKVIADYRRRICENYLVSFVRYSLGEIFENSYKNQP